MRSAWSGTCRRTIYCALSRAFVDLSAIRNHLRPFYSEMGRSSIDPELMVRMLIVVYCMGIRSERRLCNEVHLNLAYPMRILQVIFPRLIITRWETENSRQTRSRYFHESAAARHRHIGPPAAAKTQDHRIRCSVNHKAYPRRKYGMSIAPKTIAPLRGRSGIRLFRGRCHRIQRLVCRCLLDGYSRRKCVRRDFYIAMSA